MSNQATASDFDPCEWNPKLGVPSHKDDEPHAAATVSIGNGEWHLCASCAALAIFERFTERKTLRTPEETQ